MSEQQPDCSRRQTGSQKPHPGRPDTSRRLSKASTSIHDRGLIYPFSGAVVAILIIALYRIGTGAMPHVSVAGNLLIIGLGVGLVAARVGRLGPFNGKLGPPWLESDLDDTFARETARAARFGRDVAFVAARPYEKASLDWSVRLRPVDQVFRCRDNWAILILPEIDQRGAKEMLRQIEAETDVTLQAALIAPVAGENWTSQQLGNELARLVNESPRVAGITVHRPERIEQVSIAS